MRPSLFGEQYRRLRRILVGARRAAGLTQAAVAERLGRPQSFVSKYESGERRLDVADLLLVAQALGINATSVVADLEQATSPAEQHRLGRTVLDEWQITPQDLTVLLEQSPSLRGMLFGYVAELKLERIWLQRPEIAEYTKYDDHDRTKKGDRVIVYKGSEFIIESKSLQTNTITHEGGRWSAKAQVDASDRRTITLPNGTQIDTTCLLVGEFDVLAVNTFPFDREWRFVFAKNADLPRSRFRSYPSEIRQYLLATTVQVTWPPEPPFNEDLFSLLDELLS